MTINNNPPSVNLLYDQAIGRIRKQTYLTDGLVLHLDGIEGGENGIWRDLSGSGKDFTLVSCARSGRGIAFNGETSYAYAENVINENLNYGTLELAIKVEDTTSETFSAVYSPASLPSGEVPYIGAAIDTNPESTSYKQVAIDGRTNQRYRTMATQDLPSNGIIVYSCVAYGISSRRAYCVFNGVQGALTTLLDSVEFISASDTITTLGAKYVDADTRSMKFKGVIYSVRVYNKRLTVDEMKHNQHVDNLRFNLGLNI